MKAFRRALLLAVFAASALPAASPESEDLLGPSPFQPAGQPCAAGPGADPEAPCASPPQAADGGAGRDATPLGQASGDSTVPAGDGGERRPGPRALPHPALAAPAAETRGLAGAPADTAPRPTLALMPTAPGRGGRVTPEEREAAAAALRLGAEQLGRFRVLSAEETAQPWGRFSAVPGRCFTEACARRAGSRVEARLLLLSELSRPKVPGGAASGGARPYAIALALFDPAAGKVLRSLEARACPDAAPVPFLQEAAWRLLDGLPVPGDSAAAPEEDRGGAASAPPPAASGGCDRIEALRTGAGEWRDIPWLNPADSVDNRKRWGAAGGGLLLAGLGLAWAQGQLLQEDGNASSPAGTVLRDGGARSWMRGFFAAPNLGARYAALGGAGIAHARNALALILNPAGVADAARENVLAAKRSLPDGSPSLFMGYAGPLRDGWFQGLGIQHEGDGLANETVLQGALAWDWGAVSRSLAGIKTGASLKVYLAKVGEEGTGLDRSTGHSFGMGLDLGFRMPLSDRITAALSVRDALGFLRHVNTFTDDSRAEILPPEYRIGAAYQATPSMLMLLDGQKAMVADQVDHVRLGVERVAFGFLALRGGLHQAFGREAVRKLALGFGLDSDGMGDHPLPGRLAVHYAYEFGLGEDQPLGGGQQFSLEFDW